MVLRRKREILLLEAHDIDVVREVGVDIWAIPGTEKFIDRGVCPYSNLRIYARYSNAVNMGLSGSFVMVAPETWKLCDPPKGEMEWIVPRDRPHSIVSLKADHWEYYTGTVHIDEYILEMGPESYSAECDSYCMIFEWIGDRFYDIEEWWVDFGLSAESWWVIGDEVKALANLVSVPFREIKEFFYQLDEWCEGICQRLGTVLSIDAIIATLMSTFGILTQTASELVTWLYSSLQEAINFEGLWNWVNGADDWVAAKLVDFKDGLEDWIADRLESILDKVFKE